MNCKACFEEFLPKLEDEDLCPECMDAIREGGQEIILGKHDAAIILRSENGKEWVKNVYIPNQEDPEAPVSNVTLAAVMFAMGVDDPEIIKLCQDRFYEGLELVKESEAQAVAEDEISEESPDTTEQS